MSRNVLIWKKVKGMPDRAATYLFNNLLQTYLLNPYYVPNTVASAQGIAATEGNSVPGVPPAEVLPLSDPGYPVSLQIFWECGYLLHMKSYGTVGMPFLDPREQGPGSFCAEEDVRVCVSQCFDQRHTAVTRECLGNVIWVPQGTSWALPSVSGHWLKTGLSLAEHLLYGLNIDTGICQGK